MQELTTILSESDLAALRSAYDAKHLVGSNQAAVGRLHARLAPFQTTVGSLFYEASPLRARDRELALIALLAQSSAGIALATHVYWGLMEGLAVEEVCEVVGLTAAYCGMPTYTAGLMTLHRTLLVLHRLAGVEAKRSTPQVYTALVVEFTGLQL